MFVAESFSQYRRGQKKFIRLCYIKLTKIYTARLSVFCWINIYAFSRFVDLQSSNMYSWSIRWWKLQLVVQVYAGEMAHFCHSFTLGK